MSAGWEVLVQGGYQGWGWRWAVGLPYGPPPLSGSRREVGWSVIEAVVGVDLIQATIGICVVSGVPSRIWVGGGGSPDLVLLLISTCIGIL